MLFAFIETCTSKSDKPFAVKSYGHLQKQKLINKTPLVIEDNTKIDMQLNNY